MRTTESVSSIFLGVSILSGGENKILRRICMVVSGSVEEMGSHELSMFLPLSILLFAASPYPVSSLLTVFLSGF